MSIQVLRCDDAPVPIVLTSYPITQTGALPIAEDIDELVPVLDSDGLPRVIVLGDDAALAAVLTQLMRTERLDVEIGYVPTEKTHSCRAYGLGAGNPAARRALEGQATKVPLVRDDTGTALVGRATIVGSESDKLTGEAYVDDTPLFSGKVKAMLVTPTRELPGVRARVRRGMRKRQWEEGRAAQLGTPGAVVVRDGIMGPHPVRRTSFYRHQEPWLLVR